MTIYVYTMYDHRRQIYWRDWFPALDDDGALLAMRARFKPAWYRPVSLRKRHCAAGEFVLNYDEVAA